MVMATNDWMSNVLAPGLGSDVLIAGYNTPTPANSLGYNAPGANTPGVGTSSSTSSSYIDPWASYRPQAASQLAGTLNQTDPSQIFQQQLQSMMTGSFSPSDPSYQWRFQQGQQAVERSSAASGLLNSGNAAIAVQNYGQNAASQEYQAQFQRLLQGMTGTESTYNTQQQRLMELAGIQTPTQVQNAMTSAGQANSAIGNTQFQQQQSLAEQAGISSWLSTQNQGTNPYAGTSADFNYSTQDTSSVNATADAYAYLASSGGF